MSAVLPAIIVAQLVLMVTFFSIGRWTSGQVSPWLMGLIGKILALNLIFTRVGGLGGPGWRWIHQATAITPARIVTRALAQAALELLLPINLLIAALCYGAFFHTWFGALLGAPIAVLFAVAISSFASFAECVVQVALAGAAPGRFRGAFIAVGTAAAAAGIGLALTAPTLIEHGVIRRALGLTPGGLMIEATLNDSPARSAAVGATSIILCVLLTQWVAQQRLPFGANPAADRSSGFALQRTLRRFVGSATAWLMVRELRFCRSWPLLWLRLHLAPVMGPVLLERVAASGPVPAPMIALFVWGPLLMLCANLFGFQANERRWLDASPVQPRQELVAKHALVLLLGHYAILIFAATDLLAGPRTLMTFPIYVALIASGSASLAVGTLQSVLSPKPVGTSLGFTQGLKDAATVVQAAVCYAVARFFLQARSHQEQVLMLVGLVVCHVATVLFAQRRMETYAFTMALQKDGERHRGGGTEASSDGTSGR